MINTGSSYTGTSSYKRIYIISRKLNSSVTTPAEEQAVSHKKEQAIKILALALYIKILQFTIIRICSIQVQSKCL